jgi:hypothetical protein
MLGMAMGLFSSPKNLMYIGLAIAALTFGVMAMNFIKAKHEAEARVVVLEFEVTGLEERLETQAFLKDQADAALLIADTARLEAEELAASYDAIRRNALRGGNDEAVPPSLHRTLDALGSVDGVVLHDNE